VNVRNPSDESGDTATQKADEDLGPWEDSGFVAENKRRKNSVYSNSAMGGISFMQNDVRCSYCNCFSCLYLLWLFVFTVFVMYL
jgi:hypothetical protein